MKSTFFRSGRRFSGSRIHALCLQPLLVWFVVAFDARAQVSLDPQLAALPVVQAITQAPVLRDPIDYVGDQAPDPVESENPWSAIEVMRQNGPAIRIAALELVQSFSYSVWTPSLRYNLAVYHGNRRRHLVALTLWEPICEATNNADSGSAKAVADFALALYTKQISLRQQNVNSAASGEAEPALRPRTDQRSEDQQNENPQIPAWQVATSPESTTRSD